MSTPNPTRTLATITVPDTPTITAAIAYARTQVSPPTFNHVMRSWLVGTASISHLAGPLTQSLDHEAFAVAAILHDLGWSHNAALITPDKRFEVDGANAARAFLHARGWEQDRCQRVWDAIALHTIPSIACHAAPLTALVSAGTMTELFGPGTTLGLLGPGLVGATEQEWEAISREFPREGLKGHLHDTLVGLCRSKPEGTYGTWVGDFGEEFLKEEGWSQVGRRGMDLLETLTRE
jgi:hypothetical protein